MDIRVYNLSYCPYSKKALDFLDEKGLKYESIVCDNQKEELKKKHFYSTFPQVFIDGKMIGGYTELTQLEEQDFFEAGDINLLVDKVELGKIYEHMYHKLIEKNYKGSGNLESSNMYHQKAEEIYSSDEIKKLYT